MGGVYLNFLKASDSVSCNTLMDKQMKQGLRKYTMRWTESHSILPLEGQVTNVKQLGSEPPGVLVDMY